MDAEQGEVAHRLEKDRDGTDILAEGAIVHEQDGEEDYLRRTSAATP